MPVLHLANDYFPENTQKTQENPGFHVDQHNFPVDICSGHLNSLECIFIEQFSPNLP